MTTEKYSSGKKYGRKIVIRGYIPEEYYKALKEFAPQYETRWESTVLRRVIFEWVEMQKNKKGS